MASAGNGRRVLFIVENLPSPFDRRIWQEATTLQQAGYLVSIICPTGPGCEKRFEVIDDIAIYRHPLPLEAEGALGYALEYGSALFWEFRLAWRVWRERGFDAIHAANPPDLIFLVAGFFKLFMRKKFLFDHHDINPELYEAKFNRRDLFWKLMLFLERCSFAAADVSIATNESYRRIALERGRMRDDRVFVVRSGPKLERLKQVPPVPALRCGRRFLVGYVGVMGRQEGIDLLLEAVAHLVHRLGRTDVHFGLVGGGPSPETEPPVAAGPRPAQDLTFTRRVDDARMLEMLNTADVCVNPDVANEMNDKSTMNKIMEYMALGKPIVQFDLAEGRFSAQDASLHARPNDVVDLAEKIVALLDDPERLRAMGEFGRQRVTSELEWRYEAPKLLAAYDTLFEGRAPVTARADGRGRATR